LSRNRVLLLIGEGLNTAQGLFEQAGHYLRIAAEPGSSPRDGLLLANGRQTRR
jgi:hypothetical protein